MFFDSRPGNVISIIFSCIYVLGLVFVIRNIYHLKKRLTQEQNIKLLEAESMSENEEDHFYTSALATATFLSQQCPGGSVYVIGEAGITNALYNAGFSMNDSDPDYVVVSESSGYNYEKLEHAVNLVLNGAKLIGTNPDLTGPTEKGIIPATGALMAPIELTTNSKAYYVGKPNPIMMRTALKRLECRREDTVVVGDRMDTDIIAGIEAGITTVLVLSGVTSREEMKRFAYRPDYILESVGNIIKC